MNLIKNGTTMTSKEMAELTNKEHKNIMADIRDEIQKLEKEGETAELIFQLGEYKDLNNQSRPMYVFGRDFILNNIKNSLNEEVD